MQENEAGTNFAFFMSVKKHDPAIHENSFA